MRVQDSINVAMPGEPGFYVNVQPRPTDGHPLRAQVITPTARAVWNSPEQARKWAGHPGTFPVMVERYTAWAGERA